MQVMKRAGALDEHGCGGEGACLLVPALHVT